MFGHVISGQEIVRRMESTAIDANSQPVESLQIGNCGELVLQLKAKGKAVFTPRSHCCSGWGKRCSHSVIIVLTRLKAMFTHCCSGW